MTKTSDNDELMIPIRVVGAETAIHALSLSVLTLDARIKMLADQVGIDVGQPEFDEETQKKVDELLHKIADGTFKALSMGLQAAGEDVDSNIEALSKQVFSEAPIFESARETAAEEVGLKARQETGIGFTEDLQEACNDPSQSDALAQLATQRMAEQGLSFDEAKAEALAEELRDSSEDNDELTQEEFDAMYESAYSIIIVPAQMDPELFDTPEAADKIHRELEDSMVTVIEKLHEAGELSEEGALRLTQEIRCVPVEECSDFDLPEPGHLSEMIMQKVTAEPELTSFRFSRGFNEADLAEIVLTCHTVNLSRFEHNLQSLITGALMKALGVTFDQNAAEES